MAIDFSMAKSYADVTHDVYLERKAKLAEERKASQMQPFPRFQHRSASVVRHK
jgi:hypothetical protein